MAQRCVTGGNGRRALALARRARRRTADRVCLREGKPPARAPRSRVRDRGGRQPSLQRAARRGRAVSRRGRAVSRRTAARAGWRQTEAPDRGPLSERPSQRSRKQCPHKVRHKVERMKERFTSGLLQQRGFDKSGRYLLKQPMVICIIVDVQTYPPTQTAKVVFITWPL